jgi:hypothetical protein
MERETGIEPAQSAWKAEVLPLNYSRTARNSYGGGRWIRTTEGVSQQIYSLPPLAAWVFLQQRTPIVASTPETVNNFRTLQTLAVTAWETPDNTHQYG